MASSRPIGADALAGLGLQADALGLDAEDVGHPLADGLAMGQELGTLGEDDAVEVDDLPAQRGDGVAGAAASISAESRPRLAGSVSGNIWPMSPRAAAPSRASITACSSASASLWPTDSRSWGMSMPPSRSGPPGRSRCVSCPIPTRIPSVAWSPCCAASVDRTRGIIQRRGEAETDGRRNDECDETMNAEDRMPIAVIRHSAFAFVSLPFPPLWAGPIIDRVMAIIEIEGLAKSYRVYQKKEGLAGRDRRAVPPPVSRWSRPSAASTCGSSRASSSPFWGPTGPARPPRSNSSPA